MTVREIFQPTIVVGSPGESLAEAARRMADRRVGSLAITDGDRLVGILTERDLVRAVAEGADPGAVTTADYMTADPCVIRITAEASEAVTTMIRVGARHLPVVEHGRVVGMVSIRDLVLSPARVRARSKKKKALTRRGMRSATHPSIHPMGPSLEGGGREGPGE